MNDLADALSAKVIVFQCLASFKHTKKNEQNLVRFFSSIERGAFHVVWEPRSLWQKEEIKDLCKHLSFTHCVDPFKDEPPYGDTVYSRFRGKGWLSIKYKEEDLKVLSGKVRQRKTVHYVMFNNVYMFEDACTFSELIILP